MTSLAESIPTLESLILKAKNTFQKEYGSSNDGIVCGVAPGRVNLIGEHTDYNDGFVLPMALPLVTVVLRRKTDENGRFSIESFAFNHDTEASIYLHCNVTKNLKTIFMINI